jgi:phosphate starvation-inducible protein PhoH
VTAACASSLENRCWVTKVAIVIAVVEFTRRDVVRHALVQRIIAAYEEHRGKSRPERE